MGNASIHVGRLIVGSVGPSTGKTAISLGIATALKRYGLSIQTFKMGPDFVDCLSYSRFTNRPTPRLDPWVLSNSTIRDMFLLHTSDADIALVEGAHGLFDGPDRPDEADGYPFPQSTAALSHMLDAPLVLVIDTRTIGETAIAVVLGAKQLDPSLQLAGVILNHVGDPAYARRIEDLMWKHSHIPTLGMIPRLDRLEFDTEKCSMDSLESGEWDATLEELGDAIERYCTLPLITRIIAHAAPLERPAPHRLVATGPKTRIGVAFDAAFHSYFENNLELIQDAGGTIIPISPLDDATVAHNIDALYIGGECTPEYLDQLLNNQHFLASLRLAHLKGLPIFAEHGGALLCAHSDLHHGESLRAADMLPTDIALLGSGDNWGYRVLHIATPTFLGGYGQVLRGYESQQFRLVHHGTTLPPVFTVSDPEGNPLGLEGWVSGSLVATAYPIDFGQDPAIAARFVALGAAHAAQRTDHLAGASSRSMAR